MSRTKGYSIISLFLYIALSAWWVMVQFLPFDTDANRELFSATYGVMALWGGIIGLIVSKRWGGGKSALGRALMNFSIGLLLQVFGQISYSAYTYLFHIEIPYPSIGDIGFFGSIFFYIMGAWHLATTVGIGLALDKFVNKICAFIIPTASIFAAYMFFRDNLEFIADEPLTTLLNFGYPFGQAIYVSIALLAYLLSWKLLGGIMRPKLSLLLLSLILQYASDFVFLVQTFNETWLTAGFNELMYLSAYFMMTMSLVFLDNTFGRRKSNNTNG